jgi:hypothetical protein
MMISNLLLRVSVVLLMIGLALGMVMGIRQDFSLMPVHAHLNLIGFVLMFAAGLYYRLVPAAGEGLLATTQGFLHIVGAIVLPAGLAAMLSWGPGYELIVVIGSIVVFVAMALFAVIVYRTTAAARAATGSARQPA